MRWGTCVGVHVRVHVRLCMCVGVSMRVHFCLRAVCSDLPAGHAFARQMDLPGYDLEGGLVGNKTLRDVAALCATNLNCKAFTIWHNRDIAAGIVRAVMACSWVGFQLSGSAPHSAPQHALIAAALLLHPRLGFACTSRAMSACVISDMHGAPRRMALLIPT